MPKPLFRLLAGLLCIAFVVVGVSLAFMYDDLWKKICFISIALSGVFYGFYALRGSKQ